MQNYFLFSAIRKTIRRTSERRKKIYYDYNSFSSIMIFVDESELEEALPFIDKLVADRKHLYLWVWSEKEDVEKRRFPGVEDVVYVTKKDIVYFTQTVKRAILNHFLSIKVDVLCDLMTTLHYPMLSLLANSSAAMKIGQLEFIPEIYDFKINGKTPLTVNNLTQNVLFYWKRIDRKNNNL